jgi:aminoglycoside/choline kinase family phosphotransferase
MTTQDKMIGFARETLELPADATDELLPLSGRGSDREYFRFRWNAKHTVILVRYDPGRIENGHFADIARFLLDNGIAAPHIIRHDETRCLIIMQDLGDTDLWSLRNEPWKIRKILYQKTLAIAHKLHSFDENLVSSGCIRLMEPFGPDLYRWERNYFLDNFVHGLCRIKPEPRLKRQIETELEGLARKLSGLGSDLVHRDLQSQNVLICAGAPFLIDFQGMRFGTRFYDLGSLLWDPYVSFSAGHREELLYFYYGISKPESDWSSFQDLFLKASVQRLMQALGAYGYLGLRMGLKSYLEHVPAGLLNLHTAAEDSDSLPGLLEICTRCGEALAKAKIEFGGSPDPTSNQDIR